jgi:hypothetical protein
MEEEDAEHGNDCIDKVEFKRVIHMKSTSFSNTLNLLINNGLQTCLVKKQEYSKECSICTI